MDETSTGYFSSVLVPPVKLYMKLKNAVLKVPTSLSLTVNNELNKVYSYYYLAKVYAMEISNFIRLIIKILLQTTNICLELYSAKVLHVIMNA